MSAIIQLKNINFWYDHGKANEMWALHNINLDIEKGDYVAFFGPSGSGKTTLLYLLSGTEMSQAGEVVVNGRDIAKFSQKELAIYRQMGVGMIFQQFNLIPNLNILDNVALPMSFLGIDKDQRNKHAMELLERLNIAHLAKRFPYELSGGQQQRVGIARALANDAPIIIADEPIGNLDSVSANNVLDFLKELHEKDGKTVIMVTHEAWSLRDAKEIFYMKDGSIERSEKAAAKESSATNLSGKMYKQLVPNKETKKVISYTLTNLLLRGYSPEEMERFSKFLNQRLTGEIDSEQLLKVLNTPFRKGGGGLWKQRALQVSRYVEGIIQEHISLESAYAELEGNPTVPLYHEIEQITEWLLENYKGHMDELQKTRFQEVVGEVLRNIISPEAFKNILYMPKKDLGIGLSLRTTQQIYEKFKMALGSFDMGNAGDMLVK